MASEGIVHYASPSGRWVIFATVLGSGMAAIDATVVGIALPTIGRDFHATLAALHWVVSGATLTTVALAGIVYGLIEGPSKGWADPLVLVSLVVGVVCAVAFVFAERQSPAPMLPLSLFSLRQFTVTNGVTFVVYAALGGVLFLLPVTLQVVGHYSPLEAGLSLLPLTA